MKIWVQKKGAESTWASNRCREGNEAHLRVQSMMHTSIGIRAVG